MKAQAQSLKEMYGKPNCWEKSSAPLVRFWTGDTSCWGFPFFAVAGTEYVPDRSGCSPPRLSTTQLPSTSDRQCSVRLGLSPSCWCALSGALAGAFPTRQVASKYRRCPRHTCPTTNRIRR